MSDEVLRRIIEQAQGQGGAAFARRMPSIQERTAAATDPALDLMAARAGQTPAAYLDSIAPEAAAQHQRRIERNRLTAMEPQGDGMNFPTQADLDQRYRDQQMAALTPQVPSRMTPPEAGTAPTIAGESVPPARGTPPFLPEAQARAGVPAPEGEFTPSPFGMAANHEGGRGVPMPDTPPGLTEDDYLTTGMSGIYRTDSNEGIPPPPPPQTGLSYGMPSAGLGGDVTPTYGQVIPGRPGETQNAPRQSGLGPVAPTDPAAYSAETGTRPEEARKLSFMERVFGERGSDQSKNAGKALMMAGAAIMSTPGTIGEAVGAGIQAGLLTYDEAQKALSDEAKEARQMGMEDEAHQLDMELKRLQIQRGRQAGSLAAQAAKAGKPDKLNEALILAARLVTEAEIDENKALDIALGAQGITNKMSPNKTEDPLAALFE